MADLFILTTRIKHAIFPLFPFLTVAGLTLIATLSIIRRLPRTKSLTIILMGNLFFLLLFLVLSVTIFELYFRFFYDTTDNYAIQTSAAWEARHIIFNNQGFRDTEFSNPKRRGVVRIGVLGDSFTFGQGIVNIENRATNIIEEKLKERDAVEVYNLGVSGASTRDEIDVLFSPEILAAQFDFDLLLLIYVFNDIDDDIVRVLPDPIDRAKTVRMAQPLKTVFDHSDALEFFLVRAITIAGSFTEQKNERALAAYADDASWKRHQQTLAFLHSYAEDASIPLIVALFPFIHRLESYPATSAHDRVRAFLQSRGIQTLDLLPTFHRYPSSSLVVNRFDAHPNEQAHAVAAEAIAQFILQRNLLEQNEISPEDSTEIVRRFERAWSGLASYHVM